MSASAPRDLVDLMLQRREHAYDPWQVLSTRVGIDIRWHAPGPAGSWERCAGFSSFPELSTSLRLGLDAAELRCTLTHELIHLERGPFMDNRTGFEENSVSLLHSKRLVDPVLFAALLDRYPSPTDSQVRAVLDVDPDTYGRYYRWRQRVRTATAERVWDERNVPVTWPPAWIEASVASDREYELAARATGVL